MKPFFILCAISCFIAVFRLPIEYYTFLRIFISIGALIVIYNALRFKHYYVSILFLGILTLFNPIFPIYLYKKSIWIPLDVITGVLFLLLDFIEKTKQKKEEKKGQEKTQVQQTLPKMNTRDIIINPKKTKQD